MASKNKHHISAEGFWKLRDAIENAQKEGLNDDSFYVDIKFNKARKAIGFQIIGEASTQYVEDVGDFKG